MKRGVVFGILLVFFFTACAHSESTIDTYSEVEEEEDLFIVANPIDLSQILEISKFRSCAGHDYSGYNIDGEKETLRSMKHYLEPLPSFLGTDHILIFAPFDGEVYEIKDSAPGKQLSLSAQDGWQFIFFHVTPADGIEEGSFVKAGDQIGIASKDIHNFDMALKQFGFTQVFDSPFLHMTESVLQEYAQEGVTLENIIISKEIRDAEPCPLDGEIQGDALFASRDHSLDFVMLHSDLLSEAPPETSLVEEESPEAFFPGGTVLYKEDEVTIEHYFPNTGSLGSDESEIYIYNEGAVDVEVQSSDMIFIVDDIRYEQYSGTWEKFPSFQSWETIEYVNIHPNYYQGEALILEPGQKGKLHWHYQFNGDILEKEHAVDIDLVFMVGEEDHILSENIVRSDENTENEYAEDSGH